MNYFNQGLQLGSAVRNHRNRLDLEEEKKRKEEAALLAKEDKALENSQNKEINTKARLAFTILNSDDPESEWGRAMKTHPGLVNEATDRRVVKDWIIGGMESGALGKDYLATQQKALSARYKTQIAEMNNQHDIDNDFRENKMAFDRTRQGYDLDRQLASHQADERIRVRDNASVRGMQDEAYNSGVRKSERAIQFDNKLKAQNNAMNTRIGVQNNSARLRQQPPQIQPGGSLPMRQGGVPMQQPAQQSMVSSEESMNNNINTAGMKLTADIAGLKEPKDIAAVWGETKSIINARGLDMQKDGPMMIKNVARVKAVENMAIKVLGTQGINPEDAVVALRAVGKGNPGASDEELIRMAMEFVK